MLTFRISLSEDESVVEEDRFTVDIFDHDDELLSATTNLLIPSEVRSDRQIDTKQQSHNGLYLRLKVKLRGIVDESMNELVSILNAEKLTNLRWGEVEIAVPRELLPFGFTNDFSRHALKLAQWSES